MSQISYLESRDKSQCYGCEACAQACRFGAISIVADEDGFRYPLINQSKCMDCGACRKVCIAAHGLSSHAPQEAYGGYVLDNATKMASTSGGFFSAIVDAWADDNTIIFGAETDGLEVRHSWVEGKSNIGKFRKSKYLQSRIGNAYVEVKRFLAEGRRVIFSGTPCQIAALKLFLDDSSYERLLTIEVVCEGVPSPLYIKKFAVWLGEKFDSKVTEINYRCKDGCRWDFEVMQTSLQNPTSGTFKWTQDRWFNPFWSIWLQHLMSRPSCYRCKFAARERVADITLGDLWGVHLYCPELYGRNGGCSVAFCNTAKGVQAMNAAKNKLYGHALPIKTAIHYQGPLCGHIQDNPRRDEFMSDLKSLPYTEIVKKYAKRPTLKLLFQKYVWGNRQKVWWWNLRRKWSRNHVQ